MKILVIDDEENIGKTIKNILEDENEFYCDYVLDCKTAYNKLANSDYDIILLDVKLPYQSGLDVLKKIKKLYPEKLIIMISGHSGIKEAVFAIKNGAFDFLEKPLSLQRLKMTILNAKKYLELYLKNKKLTLELSKKYEIIGKSKAISEIKNLIEKVAKTDSKVLIRGESGTGKELVAFAIHNKSKRANKPFIKFNSSAIPNELVESELFGHEKGAFTGANKLKKGKLEEANGGTLFLDEIGDMNIEAQAKILRVLQDGEFERVGSNKTIKVDIRIIAATHRNLEKMIEEGKFRHDLFYRLNVIPIYIPPLRERKEDIKILSEYFLERFSLEFNTPKKILSKKAMELLSTYPFKGNVRELRNILERIYIMSDKQIIEPDDLHLIENNISNYNFWEETRSFKEKREEFERKYLETQLKKFNYNISKTALALQLQVSNLSRKLKQLKIDCQKKDK